MERKKNSLENFDFKALIDNTDSPHALEGFVTPAIEAAYKSFRNKEENKRIIEFSEYYKEKIE